MSSILERIYERYNQFGDYYEAYTVKKQYTMIQILKESKNSYVDIESKIKEYEIERVQEQTKNSQELVMYSEEIQPKSVILRGYYLRIIANSIPESFYERMGISGTSIVELSMAITLYYFGLQTYKFSEVNITETEKKNVIGRDDFYIELSDIQKVRGKTTSLELKRYVDFFAQNIIDIRKDDMMGLFLDDKNMFIICIDEFLDYMIFKLEKLLKENYRDTEYSLYTTEKGYAFEEMVYEITKNFVEENYHTLYYYPNEKQKIEIDVLLRDKHNLVVLECKSGTFNPSGIDDNEVLKLQIHNKTLKAYNSLKHVTDYLINEETYHFKCGGKMIDGKTSNPICIHVTMYPMDFISSNVHTLFPEYLNGNNNPILTISLEHLFAIMIDTKRSKKDVFEYWNQRKKDIVEHPGICFDDNELDLYYEIVNADKNTMLAEIKRQGLLDQMSPNLRIISSFHNEFGEEIRPAKKMLLTLDQYLILGIFENGKSCFGINKRYLKNLEEYIRIE